MIEIRSLPFGIVLLSLLILGTCESDFYSKIYYDVMKDQTINHCVRRLNATKQIGCSSKEGANVGVLHLVKDQADIQWIVSKGSAHPYVAILTIEFYSMETLSRFHSSEGRVEGVLVIDETPNSLPNRSISPDSSCPNEEFSLYADSSQYNDCSKQSWNYGSPSLDIMFNDWPFPIFLINNITEINQIMDCHKRQNIPDSDGSVVWPLCATQLTSPMFATKNSATCKRRKSRLFSLVNEPYCYEMKGENIFSPYLSTSSNQTIANRSVIILASRMDSFSFFDDLSPAADSVYSGLITLFAVAHTLASYRSEIIRLQSSLTVKTNVLFSLFDAESFGYIGSSSAVHDMVKENKFPVDPEEGSSRAQLRMYHFSHFIELNQLALHENSNLWIHANSSLSEEVIDLISIIKERANHFNLTIDPFPNDTSVPFPPSSVQSFLKHDPSLIGVVITNHKIRYTNRFYHSIYDNHLNLKEFGNIVNHLAKAAQVISSVIYKLLTDKHINDIKVEASLIERLIDCYLVNSSCSLFRETLSPTSSHEYQETPYSTFSLAKRSDRETLRFISYSLLKYLSGQKIETDKENCSRLDEPEYEFNWINGPEYSGLCLKSQVTVVSARSPAFRSDQINSKLYWTWTESHHQKAKLRIFYKPSMWDQLVTLMIGIAALILSFMAIFWIKKNSQILFDTCELSEPSENSISF